MTGLAMMPWFPGDFMKSTRGWSVTAKGVYRELLDAQWDMGGLPADPDELRGLIGATESEWSIGWNRCELKFPQGADGLRRNLRLEVHRAESEKRREEARQHGLAGANGRWGKGKGRKGRSGTDARAMPEHSERTAGAMPEVWPQAPSPSLSPSPSQAPSSAQVVAAAAAPPARAKGKRKSAGTPETRELADWLRPYGVRIESAEDHKIAAKWIRNGMNQHGLLTVIAYTRFMRDKPYPATIFAAYIDPIIDDSDAEAHEFLVPQLHAEMRAYHESNGGGASIGDDDAVADLHRLRESLQIDNEY
jgi:uncharacterized protein YdaU (DUF1376 family)